MKLRLQVMRAKPIVSICIPTYNASNHIDRTMASVLYQDHSDREVLIVDDASKDETWQKLQRYSGLPGVRLVRNERNLGIGANWNRCLELAESDYVKYVHCDDICYPDCVSSLAAEAANHPEAALVFSARDFLLDDVPPSKANLRHIAYLLAVGAKQKGLNAGKNIGKEILNLLFPECMNVVGEPTATLIRKRTLLDLGGFDVRYRQLIDIEAWVRILLDHDAVFIPRALCQWRVHSRQASSVHVAEGRILPELCLLYLKHRDALKTCLESAVFRRFAWSIWANLLFRKAAYAGQLEQKDYREAIGMAYRDQGGVRGIIPNAMARASRLAPS